MIIPNEIAAPTPHTICQSPAASSSLIITADFHKQDSETGKYSQESSRVQVVLSFGTDPGQSKKFHKSQNSLFLTYKPSQSEVS